MLVSPDPPVGEGEDALLPLPRHTESGLSVNNLGADLKAVKSFKNGDKKYERRHARTPLCLQSLGNTEIMEGKSLFNCQSQIWNSSGVGFPGDFDLVMDLLLCFLVKEFYNGMQ